MAGRSSALLKRLAIVALWVAAGCSPVDAADQRLDDGVERRLRATFRDALSAQRCAVAMPCLDPIYPLPGSMVARARAAACDGRRSAQPWSACGGVGRAADADRICCPATRRTSVTAPGTGRNGASTRRSTRQLPRPWLERRRRRAEPRLELVKALVAARWAAEHSRATNCVEGGSDALAEVQKGRLEKLRVSAARLGRAADVAARRSAVGGREGEIGTATPRFSI